MRLYLLIIQSMKSKSNKTTRRVRKGKPRKNRRNKKRRLWLLSAIIAGLLIVVGFCLSTGQQEHHGIDVSRYQGKINWEEVAEEGEVEFVFAKATEGKSYKDPTYTTNRDGARSHHIPFGAYHFFTTNASGEAQFANFRAMVGKDIDLKPVLDLEEDGGKIQDLDKYHQEIKSFIEACQKYYGCRPIIYASTSFFKDYRLQQVIDGCPYWMAWYTQLPFTIVSRRRYLMMRHPGSQAIIWQYSEKGHHRGINGYVDMNECWEIPTILL